MLDFSRLFSYLAMNYTNCWRFYLEKPSRNVGFQLPCLNPGGLLIYRSCWIKYGGVPFPDQVAGEDCVRYWFLNRHWLPFHYHYHIYITMDTMDETYRDKPASFGWLESTRSPRTLLAPSIEVLSGSSRSLRGLFL